ncbi:2Fe-2S iron-sulfur cluster binding domain-containing protein [Streptomyces piniterrae]|uniref:2Fe-2S iron-sulfur cluster binding domain-containing protein n=1 Tax=Streptomyces piniterrae TaxID=2571125 RepID=A0A4U0N3H3_9ACTN|nr:molybdopterin cofactor-binding domain-containing protein [Streptomyces piniterrae]TJZ44134.1 2Fe-2S iron-sulfur cluster binding domain-containing protein [Streptomyces piniterrae]
MGVERFSVNGVERSFESSDTDSALDVVRDQIGLTGAKRVCEAGACGACTVLVDGAPAASCLMPSDTLGGRRVVTVEGLGGGDRLHPVQRAFLAQDAVQCGYCTPGFVLAGVAFFEDWRAEHGTGVPPESEIRAALSGQLCRCGCYLRILDAVREACAGRYDDGDDAVAHRHETLEKVTGRAEYTTDVRYPSQLEGVLVTSPYANAVVREMDDGAAAGLPGVRAVVRLLPEGGRIRHAGQEIVAVAADTAAAAREAAAAVKIRYDHSPAATSMDAAMAEGAPLVYGPKDRKSAPSAGEVPVLFPRRRWRGNVCSPAPPLAGRAARADRAVRRAFEEGTGAGQEAAPRAEGAGQGGAVVDGVWRTAGQSHVPLEAHACVASWDGDSLTVHLSTQAVSLVAHAVARRWHLKSDQVRVLADHVGGAFGAKQGLTAEAVAAIELSRASGRPVRVVLDQRAELAVGGHRPASRTHLALRTGADGGLTALRVEAFADTGTALGSDIAKVAGLLYPGAPRTLRDHSVVSHRPPGKPFRAPSGPPAFWALEQAVDEAAHRQGRDPLELRRAWDTEPVRRRLYDWVATATPWPERGPVAAGGGPVRRGLGLAAAAWYYYLQPRTKVRARVDTEGVEISVATQEIGTGCRSLLVSVFADGLGLAPGEVRARIGDSRLTPGPLAAGSSTTASLVPAAHDTLDRLRRRLLATATRELGLRAAAVALDGIRHAGGTVTWREALRLAAPTEVTGRRPRDRGRRPEPWYSPFFGRGQGAPSIVQVTEVEVDERFGLVRVVRTWCGLAVGRAVRPVLATTQCHGAVIQSIGQTLYEERLTDPATGLTLHTSLENYPIPGIGDVPEITVDFVPGGFDHVAQQAVGLAELAALATPASIGNAVFHATGRRMRSLPLDPAQLLGEAE